MSSPAFDGYRERPPPAALAPFVSALWTSEPEGSGGTHRVLPDGCIDVLFSWHHDLRGARARLRVVGPMTSYLDVEDPGRIAAVRFRPGGATPLLGVSAASLRDQSVPLDALWGREGRELLDRLGEIRGVRQVLPRLVEALLVRRRRAPTPDALVADALGRIEQGLGCGPVSPLARDCGLGERHFRRRFEAAVGLSPKRLARIVRLQHLLAAARRSPRRSWTDLALDFGYCDQAHLVSDFKSWTGHPPARYLGHV